MIDARKLQDWRTTLQERKRRTTDTPKRSWAVALAAIDGYEAEPNEANETYLRRALREAEIYVPREL